ncbi:MAG: ATP-binding protein [Pseudomonadota bacterium]|nr:ATP-binding protein [Pseudomonadota bacterium]
MNASIFKVVSVTGDAVSIEIVDMEAFKTQAASRFTIGAYLRVMDEEGDAIIAVVRSYRVRDPAPEVIEEDQGAPLPRNPIFIVDAHVVGFVSAAGKFLRGGQHLSIPPTSVEVADDELLSSIYERIDTSARFCFSSLAHHPEVEVPVNGNLFFGKHIAVVGATGSGKSCTVAALLQNGIEGSAEQRERGVLNNAHVVVFDLHGEYRTAFPASRFAVHHFNAQNLILPFWLMNAEELESFFMDTEANDHNQRAIFREAVLRNKAMHNPLLRKDVITYDAPVPFSIKEVLNYVRNWNLSREKGGVVTWEGKGAHAGSERTESEHADDLFQEGVKFAEGAGSKQSSRHGKFGNFVSRLQNKLSDARMNFMLGENVAAEGPAGVYAKLLGFGAQVEGGNANITVIDLSGVPFEVLTMVVSVLTRVVFDFCYYRKRYRPADAQEVPFLLVLEEAHNYVPRQGTGQESAARRAVERVAKEGRKYGLSLMIVTQRPSEVSTTIFSQCSNFVIMRLTNQADQTYVKSLLPDGVAGITDNLPVLGQREAIVLGDAVVMPSVVRVAEIEDLPDSRDVRSLEEWRKDWADVQFGGLFRQVLPREEV